MAAIRLVQVPIGLGGHIRYDECGTTFTELLERSLDLVLGVGVHSAGGLIQENHIRLFQDSPGDGYSL